MNLTEKMIEAAKEKNRFMGIDNKNIKKRAKNIISC